MLQLQQGLVYISFIQLSTVITASQGDVGVDASVTKITLETFLWSWSHSARWDFDSVVMTCQHFSQDRVLSLEKLFSVIFNLFIFSDIYFLFSNFHNTILGTYIKNLCKCSGSILSRIHYSFCRYSPNLHDDVSAVSSLEKNLPLTFLCPFICISFSLQKWIY